MLWGEGDKLAALWLLSALTQQQQQQRYLSPAAPTRNTPTAPPQHPTQAAQPRGLWHPQTAKILTASVAQLVELSLAAMGADNHE